MGADAAHLARAAITSWLRDDGARDAGRALQQAFQADEECVEAHYGVGLIALASGDLTTAEAAFARVLSLDARQANAAYHLGLIAEARGRSGDARGFYMLTLELAPGPRQAMRRLSSLGEDPV
jgi:Flp pilus assembly protein TadD